MINLLRKKKKEKKIKKKEKIRKNTDGFEFLQIAGEVFGTSSIHA